MSVLLFVNNYLILPDSEFFTVPGDNFVIVPAYLPAYDRISFGLLASTFIEK